MLNTRNVRFTFTRFLMIFSLTAVGVLMLVVSSVLYFKTKSFIDDKVDEILNMKLSQAATDLKKQFNDVYQTLDGLRNSDHFQKLVPQGRTYNLFGADPGTDSGNIEDKKLLANIARLNGSTYLVGGASRQEDEDAPSTIVIQINLQKLAYLVPYANRWLCWTAAETCCFAVPASEAMCCLCRPRPPSTRADRSQGNFIMPKSSVFKI